MNLNRRNAAKLGGLKGFMRPWCDIPCDVVSHVTRLSGQTPLDLDVQLGVTAEDMSTIHKTVIPSETVYTMIDLWITRNGKDVTLIRLLEAMEFMEKLGELKGRLADSLP